MNILPSIVDGYMFNEMVDTMDDTKKMSGGLPLSKLVGEMEFITQSGGGASRETPMLSRLGNLGVPIGLVYKPQHSAQKLQYEEGSLLPDRVIDNVLYDTLVDLVSPYKTHNKTRKHHDREVATAANRTYRNRQ